MSHTVTDKVKARATIDSTAVQDDRPKPTEFENFLLWACKEFFIEDEIIFTRAVQEDYFSNATTKKRALKLKPSRLPSIVTEEPNSGDESKSSDFVKPEPIRVNAVNIETVYDSNDNVVQLKFLGNKSIPRKVMQVLALTTPFQNHLTSITINKGLRKDSLYELSKCLPNSQITEVCLDGTFISEANYHILLTQSKLKHLSLARCSINDVVVKTIAEQLIDPCPAAKVLSALNLSSNRITDIGAKYLAGVLRTNRQLSYLNLAGNMITDEGGVSILNTLKKFPLQPEEVIESRARYVIYLKEKNALISTLFKELQTASFDKNIKKKMPKKVKLETQPSNPSDTKLDTQILQEKAEYMAKSRLGPFNETFSPDNTETQDGAVLCLGNNTLCCLNFSYNNLTYISVKTLLEVLETQSYYNRKPRGLIRVVIEGNLMPTYCEEFEKIDHLLGSKSYSEAQAKKRPLSSRSKETARSGK